jgi:hypothetical protein
MSCDPVYQRAWHLKNRERILIAQKKYRDRNKHNRIYTESKRAAARLLAKNRREYANRFKMKPCADCHIQYNPWVMHFDHLDSSTKLAHVSIIVRSGGSFSRIKNEIDKCEVVCANCHAERTHQRQLESLKQKSKSQMAGKQEANQIALFR